MNIQKFVEEGFLEKIDRDERLVGKEMREGDYDLEKAGRAFEEGDYK